MTEITLEEKEKEVAVLAGKLREQHLLFGNYVLAGMAQCDAYIKAGYINQTPYHAASRLLNKNKNLRRYVDLSREIATEKASDELAYDEKQWLEDILEAVDMSLGRKEMVTQVPFDGGNKVEVNLREVNLQAFARLSEQLGKKLTLFTEKKLIEGGLGLVTKSIPTDMPAAEAAAIYQEMIRGK